MIRLFNKKPKNRLFIDGSTLEAPVKNGQTILQAATAAKIKFPNMCNVGECGTCRCRIIEGKVKLKRDIRNQVSREDMEQGYVLGCQTIPEGDVVVRVPGLSSTDTVVARTSGIIASLQKLSHDILQVNITLDTPIHYKPGQYARITVLDEKGPVEATRNYSFASYCTREKTVNVVFYIRHVPGGQFTDWLFAQDRSGSKIELSAPFGDFYLRTNDRPVLLVAGGSGLAPIKALLEEIQAKRIHKPVTLFFGARGQRDLYELDFIESLRESWPATFNFHPILSDEPENSPWTGLRGLVTDHFEKLLSDVDTLDVYMCGPPPMLDSVITFMEGKIPKEQVYFDKFFDQSSLNTGN